MDAYFELMYVLLLLDLSNKEQYVLFGRTVYIFLLLKLCMATCGHLHFARPSCEQSCHEQA
jgi:hypothetical protein